MRARILVIEDNPGNLELMSYLLQAFGHTVDSAETGLDGLAAARQRRPDLIVCDIQLPDIDGFEIARRLRGDASLCDIPLVAVTALAMVGDRDRVLAAGFDGYLTKPIDPEMFTRQIESYLPAGPRRVPPRPSAAPGSPPHRTAKDATILAVDNLPVQLELAQCILGPFGYQVVTAGNMSDALNLLDSIAIDLILSDVQMGDSTGFEFLHAIKKNPRLASIPFVLITSTAMSDEDRDHGLALGAARYLRRPIEPEALLAEIDACLQEAGRI